MSGIKYKVLSYDPATNGLVVTFARIGEEYKGQSYNFELHNQGARDFEHLKARIAGSGVSTIRHDEDLVKARKDIASAEQYQDMVGREFEFTRQEIWAAEHPDEIKQADERAKFDELQDQYPPADLRSVEKIISMDFPNVFVEPVVRSSDKNIIGVRSAEMGTKTTEIAATSFRSLIKLTQVCREYGVPNLGDFDVDGDHEMTEKWLAFWKEHGYEQLGEIKTATRQKRMLSGEYELVTSDTAFVYMPWTPEMAAARKKKQINYDRDAVDYVEWNGETFDADGISARNMREALSTLPAGNASVSWRTRGDTMVDLTGDALEAILAEIAKARSAQYLESFKRKSEVGLILNSSQDPDAKLKAIDEV